MTVTEPGLTTIGYVKSEATACVVTYRDFPISADAVWNVLMFYEDITIRPPFLLSWFLPMPLSNRGCKAIIGNIVHCRYTGGYLRKRITNIIPHRTYAFDVTEQHLAL